MVSLTWLAHTSKLAERVNESSHWRLQKFFHKGDKVDILLVFCKLQTLQCKWTFTKRFTVSTPRSKCPIKTRGPFTDIFKCLSGAACELVTKVYFLSCVTAFVGLSHKCRLSLRTPHNWVWTGLEISATTIAFSHVLVEQNSFLKSFVRIVF